MKAFLLAGLGFGDEGKGTCVDALARHEGAGLVVRYNGGAQAAHNVVLPGDSGNPGIHHTFSQFGSGAFAGARTHLSRFMLVNPMTMLNEAKALEEKLDLDPFKGLTIEDEALVTTPIHMALNRLRELARGDARHGSCGMGIGETVDYALKSPREALRMRHLDDRDEALWRLDTLQEYAIEEIRKLEIGEASNAPQALASIKMLLDRPETMYEPMVEVVLRARIVSEFWLRNEMTKPRSSTTIFEGAQGVLLDAVYGWAPHTTWSDCTFANALELLEGMGAEITKLGVTRTFLTRHGAGPMPSEWPYLTNMRLGHDHNALGPWQGALRAGSIDFPLLRYAIQSLGGIDGLCITHLDQPGEVACTGHEINGGLVPFALMSQPLEKVVPCLAPMPKDEAAYIGIQLGVPVYLTSSGPTHADKIVYPDVLKRKT